ncbi:DUF4179 domain-containing protein [Clostridium sp.]|uniref:DUF4179 domain-containing protein n=1 Tax=Clostridium sp. TaxID=1506 RepID=UPI002FDEEEDE
MSEKNIYKDFNNITIDEHEFDDIDICMTDAQKSNLKCSLKKKIKMRKSTMYKIVAASVAGLIVLIGVGYTNPAFASKIPILNSIVEMLGQTGDYANYSDILNKTITYGGKSFTINSVLCYDNRIIIGYTVQSNNKIDSADALFFPLFKVNGKWLNVGSTGGVKNLDKNKAMGTIELICDTILPDSFKFDMSFNKLDDTTGNWDFRFNIVKAKLSQETKVYDPNQPIVLNNHNFTITQISLTPLNTLISMHSNSEGQIPGSFFDFWIILDDRGNELTQVGGSGEQSCDVTIPYSKADKSTKYLTIIPYRKYGGIELVQGIQSEIQPEESVSFNTKLPIELFEGKNSKVIINKISFLNDNNNTIIQGIIYGKLPNYQVVFLKGDNPKADIALLNTTIKKIDTDKYEFIREYSGLKNDKNYKLIAPNIDNMVDYNSRITVMLK